MSRSIKVAIVVAIAMAALIYAAMQRGRTLRANQALHTLPNTTRAVLRIDTEALSRTPAAQALLDAFVPDEQLSEIEAECGLDPFEALSEAIVWIRGPEDKPFQSVGLLLRGRTVDAEGLAQCHRTLVEARGGSVIRVETPAGPLLKSRDDRSAIAAVDDRTIVTGSARTVAELMAVRLGAVPSLMEKPQIRQLWSRVSVGAGVAAVFDPPPHWRSALERLAKLGDQASALQGIQTIALNAKTGSKQTVKVYIEAVDPVLARQDASVIQSWIDAPPDTLEQRWVDVLRTSRLHVDGSLVVMTLDVSTLSKSLQSPTSEPSAR